MDRSRAPSVPADAVAALCDALPQCATCGAPATWLVCESFARDENEDRYACDAHAPPGACWFADELPHAEPLRAVLDALRERPDEMDTTEPQEH